MVSSERDTERDRNDPMLAWVDMDFDAEDIDLWGLLDDMDLEAVVNVDTLRLWGLGETAEIRDMG